MQNKSYRRKPYTVLMDWYRYSNIRIPFFNPVARTILKTKIAIDKLLLKSYSISEKKMLKDLNQLNLFFLVGFPRSGTTFMANVLNKLLADWNVVHEPFIGDYLLSVNYPQIKNSKEYFHKIRLKDIYRRVERGNCKGYGESNPHIRLCTPYIKDIFPSASVFYIVRDPRDVVRSMMNREILRPKDPMQKLYVPPADDSDFKGWNKMSRFEKICLLWKYDNIKMREEIDSQIKLELMTENYNYFLNTIENLTGKTLDISESKYRELVAKPINPSPRYKLDHWSGWSDEKREIFEYHCFEEMEKQGYKATWSA